MNHRVATDELKALIRRIMPNETFDFIETPDWKWNDNGTYETMASGDRKVS